MKHFIHLCSILLLLLCAFPAAAQDAGRIVTGLVTDEYGDPLAGASVVIDGTSMGTLTNDLGEFSIKVGPEDERLIFSFVGFVTRKLRIRDNMEVELIESSDVLEEVISIGYLNTTKNDATGAVESISITDAENRAITSADMLLQGKSAGLEMIQDSGQPGADEMEIYIRGISSLENNSSPLVIVDGVESSLSRVNPRDIKSVSILKDASAAAIYGNRAAGGVIVIETKSGTKGLSLSYSGSASVQAATAFPDIEEDPVKYIDFVNMAWQTGMGNSSFRKYSDTARELWSKQEGSQYQPTNWRDVYIKPGFMQQHHVGASGGWERFDLSFSTGYQNQTGVVFSTSADKLDYHVKLNLYFFKKKLKLGLDMSGIERSSHEAQSSSSLLNRYLANRPILFLRGEDEGRVVYSPGAVAFAIEQLGGGTDNVSSDLSSVFTATYTPNEKLTFKATYNTYNSRSHIVTYTPNYETTGSDELESSSVHRSSLTDKSTWGNKGSFTFTGTYNTKFDLYRLNTMVGYEMRDTYSESAGTHVYDLIKNAPQLAYGNPNTLSVNSSSTEYAAMSTFGRVQLDYASRYIFETNLRYDGSSRFAVGNRWGLFPSVGFAWRANNERFLKRAEWIDNLKLRVSAGRLGNDNISTAYAYADQMTSDAFYSFGGTLAAGVAYNMFADKNTTWETVDQVNLGIDFDFLKAYRFTVDVFDKEISNMLSPVYPAISLGTGTKGAPQNVGRMRNYGIEFSGTWSRQFNGGKWLSLSLKASYIKNRVVDLGDNDELWHNTEGTLRSVVGHSAKTRYGYDCIGLYQLSDFTWQNDSDPTIPDVDRLYELKPGVTTTSLHQNVRPGDLLLRDRDGDNHITPSDLFELGRSRSDLRFSFNAAYSWKDLDVRALFQGQGPSKAFLQRNAPYGASFIGQIMTDMEDKYWTEETPQYRCLYTDKERLGIVSSFDLYDVTYLRLKNFQVGYTFRDGWVQRVNLKAVRMFLTGENLLTFSGFPKGFDPERTANNSTPTSYPNIMSFSLGASLTF